uniref:Mono-ADP ribosylhydrolase 1 n=1 Tax=Molossus molossus TaxID=27622 RepID=A0A7J8ES07_MOLMO|nr:mono-ADP ribosylhydrolase 1 [Molossus molossus]
MLYIFSKKNKTHLCFKSAPVFRAEGGGRCYKRVGHVSSPRALLLLPERVRRAWGPPGDRKLRPRRQHLVRTAAVFSFLCQRPAQCVGPRISQAAPSGAFLKGLSDKQREEHYFCQDFIRLKKVPTWKDTAKGLTGKVEEPKYKKDKHLNEKLSLFRGDITKLEVDAIVNAGQRTWTWTFHMKTDKQKIGPNSSSHSCQR